MADRSQELAQQRLAKLQRIRDRGQDPYPPRFHRSCTIAQAIQQFLQAEASTRPLRQAQDTAQGSPVTLAGRIVRSRRMGKATFIDLRDGSGRLQVHLRHDLLGAEQYEQLRDLDLGDFLGASGTLFRTQTGEITLEARDYSLLSKALLPPPEKWHGLADVEIRYRQRYLDLMANQEVREVFLARAKVVSAMRRFLEERGFIEVETPVLLPQAGGAMARPFSTHHNALDQDLVLRIATELYLKRLIVGGFDKVFEIGRIFRNEGVSTKHNPEFTTLESYEAYADYHDVMAMVEEMMTHIAREVTGGTAITYQGQTIDLTPPWRRVTLRDAILEHSGIDFLAYPDAASLRAQMEVALGDKVDAAKSWGKLVDDLLSTFVEPRLVQPTFLLDYPVELSPLAKAKREDPRLVERFEGFIGGLEIANAFTELNDPQEQRARFAQQLRQREAGDEEAELPDEDFLTALEHGMPPTGGLGVGIDRLVMLLTDQASIREVILFPQMRKKESS